ncbi:MAG: response regulator [Planctomycetes bacterium]|nr:response regulator [Planctomycetota bacterium]
MKKAIAFDILLVEDNPHDVELTKRALEKHKVANRIFVVKDGEEALEYIFSEGRYAHKKKKTNPKLILLDLKLPKVDGLEVLRRVKSDKNTKTIPVVMLTSSQMESDIIESYRLGVNSYIVKPVEFDAFAKSVSELGLYWLVINQPPK